MRNYRVIAFILGLGLAAIPASATIAYTSCTSGCSDTAGSFATLSTEPGASGLTFGSPITFISGGLSGGVYTDTGPGTGGSGAIFTSYYSGGLDTNTFLHGSSFTQGASGTNGGIEITLPANTYAFAISLSDCNSNACGSILFNNATVGIGTHSSNNAAYTVAIPSGGPAQFFAIISDSPIASLFIAAGGGASGLLSINSFEIGTQSGDIGNGDVPEPSTLFTLGGGFVGLFFWHRRRCRA